MVSRGKSDGKHHGPETFAGPGGVDRLQRDAQTRAGGVGANGGAHVGVVR